MFWCLLEKRPKNAAVPAWVQAVKLSVQLVFQAAWWDLATFSRRLVTPYMVVNSSKGSVLKMPKNIQVEEL